MPLTSRLEDLAERLAAEFLDLRAEIQRVTLLAQQGPSPVIHFTTSDGQEFLTADGQQFVPAGA